MFLPVKAHQQEIIGGQKKIRLGSRVPNDAVNLAYSHVPPLTPTENIQVTDMSGLILENVQADKVQNITMFPDTSHLLHAEDGHDYVTAETFLITNTFSRDKQNNLVPLFYTHRLQWPIYDSKGPDRFGFYQGKSVTLIDRDDKQLDPSTYVIAVSPSSVGAKYYNVSIFTSFQALPSDNYRAIYPAYVTDTTLATPISKVVPGFTEQLNPQPAFRKREDIHDVINPANSNQPWFYKTNGMKYGTTKIYGTRSLLDDGRQPVEFHFRVYAQYTDASGTLQTLAQNWLGDSCYSINSATPEEVAYNFLGSSMLLRNGVTAATLLKSAVGSVPANAVYHVESDNPNVTVATDADGNGPVLASTMVDTGRISLPQLYKANDQEITVNFGLEFHLLSPDGTTDWLALTVPNLGITQGMGVTNVKPIIRGEFSFPPGFNRNTWMLDVRVVGSVHADIGIMNYTTSRIAADKQGRMRMPYINLYSASYGIAAYTNQRRRMFLPGYQVRLDSAHMIKPLYPREQTSMENWYLRVQNGRFQRATFDSDGNPISLLYLIPEYYRQPYDETYGLPHQKVVGEKPQVIGDRRVKVRFSPLFVDTDPATNLPTNLTVVVNQVPVKVLSWNISDGSLELESLVKETDDIAVDYYYTEFSYTYRGYFNDSVRKFVSLDLNPGKGHFYTVLQNDSVDPATWETTDVPGFSLIDKTVYVYLRPTAVLTGIVNMWAEKVLLNSGTYMLLYQPRSLSTVSVYSQSNSTPLPYGASAVMNGPYWTLNGRSLTIINADPTQKYLVDYEYDSGEYHMKPASFTPNVLYHTFTPSPDSKNDILLAKIQVRPNSSQESISIIDARSRGGGLLQEIGKKIMEEIAPESKHYWDIGFWDGEPYPENSVIIIRLSERVLKEYGGQFERQDVEAAVQKHVAFGTFYIIEYVHESDLIVQIPEDLVLDLVKGVLTENQKLDTPTFTLAVENLRW